MPALLCLLQKLRSGSWTFNDFLKHGLVEYLGELLCASVLIR